MGAFFIAIVLLAGEGLYGALARLTRSRRAVFRAERLCKSFGALEVARGISLQLPRGARHAIVGPNGSGKTTLFNLLSGELKPDAGQVYIEGRDVTALSPDARHAPG